MPIKSFKSTDCLDPADGCIVSSESPVARHKLKDVMSLRLESLAVNVLRKLVLSVTGLTSDLRTNTAVLLPLALCAFMACYGETFNFTEHSASWRRHLNLSRSGQGLL